MENAMFEKYLSDLCEMKPNELFSNSYGRDSNATIFDTPKCKKLLSEAVDYKPRKVSTHTLYKKVFMKHDDNDEAQARGAIEYRTERIPEIEKRLLARLKRE